jgi:hypothetical protein
LRVLSCADEGDRELEESIVVQAPVAKLDPIDARREEPGRQGSRLLAQRSGIQHR